MAWQYTSPTDAVARRDVDRLGSPPEVADGSLLQPRRGGLPRPRPRLACREPPRAPLAARPAGDARLAAEAPRRGLPRRRLAEGVRRRRRSEERRVGKGG